MGSLADALKAAAPGPSGQRCHACDLLTDLPDQEDREWLERALNEKRSATQYAWAAKTLSESARANGLTLPEAVVRSHRNKGHAG